MIKSSLASATFHSTSRFPDERIDRQKTWSYNINNNDDENKKSEVNFDLGFLPFNIGACIISNVSKADESILNKRSIYSANLLQRTKLLLDREKKLHSANNKDDAADDHALQPKKTEEFKEHYLKNGCKHKDHNQSCIPKLLEGMQISQCSNENENLTLNVPSGSVILPSVCSTSLIMVQPKKTLQGSPHHDGSRKLKSRKKMVHVTSPETSCSKSVNVRNTSTFKKVKNMLSISPFKKKKKIYFSEKQSKTYLNGAPEAPPSTPYDDLYDSVASLSDVKSQQAVKKKLKSIASKQNDKEKEILEKAKLKEKELKIKAQETLMKKQRAMIYKLNKIMTEHENEEYMKFKQQQTGAPV